MKNRALSFKTHNRARLRQKNSGDMIKSTSLYFLLEVRMASGRPVIAVEKCKGCGLCIRACPKSLLEMSKQTNGQGVHYPVCNDESKCIACTFCATMCPDVAIEIEKD